MSANIDNIDSLKAMTTKTFNEINVLITVYKSLLTSPQNHAPNWKDIHSRNFEKKLYERLSALKTIYRQKEATEQFIAKQISIIKSIKEINRK